jgi:octaprenyl-diphosphate synthase
VLETEQATLHTAPTSTPIMTMTEIRSFVEADMRAVDRMIHEQLRSQVALIDQVGNYIVNSGGKRLRPMLVLLGAGACGYDGGHHIDLATIVEFIHTATLLHDDVVDESALRRGRDTANALWGNATSVLVGDFLYSRSFQMMVSVESMPVMRIMADTTNTIAEGEVLQLLHVHDPDTSEARYIEVIHCKTAKLFEAAARLGAVLTGQPAEREQGLACYGMHLGTAFQLIDDVLDYSADADEIGKNIGDDLAEGKPTLPLIHAMREGSAAERALIRDAIENGGLDRIDQVRAAIESTGAIQYTSRLAREEARKAIEATVSIPESKFKSALVGLADFAANRNH